MVKFPAEIITNQLYQSLSVFTLVNYVTTFGLQLEMETLIIVKSSSFDSPGAPLTYFNDGGSDIFGSQILAKRDFFGL